MKSALLTVCLLCALGCSGGNEAKPPTTYPVTGKVIGRDGKPVSGGTIEFRHLTKTDDSTRGEVDTNGVFTLHTLTSKAGKLIGAQEGEHVVTYIPAGKGESAPSTLKKKYVVKEGGGDITVTLE